MLGRAGRARHEIFLFFLQDSGWDPGLGGGSLLIYRLQTARGRPGGLGTWGEGGQTGGDQQRASSSTRQTNKSRNHKPQEDFPRWRGRREGQATRPPDHLSREEKGGFPEKMGRVLASPGSEALIVQEDDETMASRRRCVAGTDDWV